MIESSRLENILEHIVIKKNDEHIYCIRIINIPKQLKKLHTDLVCNYNSANTEGIHLSQNFFYDPFSYKNIATATHRMMQESGYELKAISCSLINKLEKTNFSLFREELANKLYQYEKIQGVIAGFGSMYFDGYDQIISLDSKHGVYNPIRKYDQAPIELLRHVDKSTLLKECCIKGTKIGDGHLWIPENLGKKGFKINDVIIITGHIEKYKRKNGTFDYCIKATRFDKI